MPRRRLRRKKRDSNRLGQILLLMTTVVLATSINSVYYSYNYDYTNLAYSANINVLSTPQLPITRPGEYRLTSDVAVPGDTAYIRGVVLYNNTDLFNESLIAVYLENPDICFPPSNPFVCLADVTLTVTLRDDLGNVLFTDTVSGLWAFWIIDNPANGAFTIISIPIQPPVLINATKSVEASVQCNIGC